MRTVLFLVLIAGLLNIVGAQEVSTLFPTSSTDYEAIAWSPQGKIYVVDYNGNKVYSLGLDGSRTILAENLPGPLGATFDADENFYFSGYNTGKVFRIDPQGTLTEIGSGFGGPSGILIDTSSNRLFVNDYNNHRVRTLNLDTGQSGLLAFGGGINGPDGIVYAPNGDLLVANFNDNKVLRVTLDGEVSTFVTLTDSPDSGYLLPFDGDYLIAGLNSHRIWRISADGNTVTLFAGTGILGGTDGPLDEATFFRPNGIAISPSNDSMIVTEWRVGRIRIITGLNTSTSSVNPTDENLSPLLISPNPVRSDFDLRLSLEQSGRLAIVLYDLTGRPVAELAAGSFPIGEHRWPLSMPALLPNGVYNLLLLQNGHLLGRERVVLLR